VPGVEILIEEAVCEEALREWGVLNKKLNGRGDTGWPDREFFIPGGKPLLIEFKAPGEEPDPKQLFIHAQLIARGYDVQTHDNKEEALRAIQAALAAAPVPKARDQVLAESLLRRIAPGPRAGKDKRHVRRR
jgi:hypothetical protein